MAAIPGLSPFVPVCFLCLPRFLVSLTPSAPALSVSILPVCFQSRLLAFAIRQPDLEIQPGKRAGAAGCLGPSSRAGLALDLSCRGPWIRECGKVLDLCFHFPRFSVSAMRCPRRRSSAGAYFSSQFEGAVYRRGRDNSRWPKIGRPVQLGLLSLIKQEAEKRQEVRWVGLLSSMPRSQWVSCFGQQGSTSQAYLTHGHWATIHRRQLWTQNS